MKLTAILGSRNPDGQTAAATAAVCDGAREEGVDVDTIFLPELDIQRCRQCDDDGWGECKLEGSCVIEDDFDSVVQRLNEADAVVFSTPVYFSDQSESMRAFTDRLRRICMHEEGKVGSEGTPGVGICVAGGGGGGAPACAVSLEKVLSRCGFDMVDMVPVRRQTTEIKHRLLKVLGSWFAGYKAGL